MTIGTEAQRCQQPPIAQYSLPRGLNRLVASRQHVFGTYDGYGQIKYLGSEGCGTWYCLVRQRSILPRTDAIHWILMALLWPCDGSSRACVRGMGMARM